MTGPNYPLRLKRAIENLPPEMVGFLKTGRAAALNSSKPDFVWHSLIRGTAMQGKASGGTALLADAARYKTITYESLAALRTASQRRNALESAFAGAGVRMAAKKADYMVENFKIVQAMGGGKEASNLARAQIGRDAKLKFVMQFKGMGAQLARDFWMSVYDSDFRNSVKLDVRIKSYSKAMGLLFDSDAEHEQYFVDLAEYVGLPDAWSLDRLLFKFRPHFMAILKQ